MRALVKRPEILTAGLLVLAFGLGAAMSQKFLDARYLLDATSLYAEGGLLALGMTFVIVSGQIDLSIASALALVACAVGRLHEAGMTMPLAAICGLAIGCLLGLFNGLLIAYGKLPSFLVTLGTLALFRGAAQALMGDHSARMPDSFVGLDAIHLAGTGVPAPFAIFLGLALILGLVLHRTAFGRSVYAVGGNEEAARHSSLSPERVKVSVFVLSGLLAAGAALMMDSRLGVARYDHGKRLELDVITAVVLGGASIYGGRGSILGTVLALLLVAVLRIGMGLARMKAEYQLVAVGALLVIAVAAGNMQRAVARAA